MPNASDMPSRKTELLTVRMSQTCKEHLTSLEGVSASTAACVIIETVLTLHGGLSLDEIVRKLSHPPAPSTAKTGVADDAKARLRDTLRVIERHENTQELRQSGPPNAVRPAAF